MLEYGQGFVPFLAMVKPLGVGPFNRVAQDGHQSSARNEVCRGRRSAWERQVDRACFTCDLVRRTAVKELMVVGLWVTMHAAFSVPPGHGKFGLVYG